MCCHHDLGLLYSFQCLIFGLVFLIFGDGCVMPVSTDLFFSLSVVFSALKNESFI